MKTIKFFILKKFFRVDGGVSQNNFICQLLADMTGLTVERSKNAEMTVLGVVFLTGLNFGTY